MKRTIWLTLAVMSTVSLATAAADGKSSVKAGARKLGDQANYSWTSENKPEGGEQRFQMSVEGKTEKAGFTSLKVAFGENETEGVRKGDKLVVLRDGEWKTPDEMEERAGRMARRFAEMKLPAGEAEDLVEKAKELKPGDGGLYSGDLTEEGVKQIFARWLRGGQGPEPKGAKGWVKFWIKDGLLTKYQFNTQGTITFGQDQQEMEVNRTTTVEIKAVGTTKVSVPDEAKKKLS
jgi:hypothetical protein